MNPYEELGVAADATEAQIRAAYRKKATKTHPDKGGSGEAFARTTKALAVLINPKSRKRFDETGDAREEPPDDKRSKALQIIEQLLSNAMAAYIQSGFQPGLDPRNRNLVDDMIGQVLASITQTKQEIRAIKERQVFLRDIRKRFVLGKKGDVSDPIGRSLENQIKAIESAVDAGNVNIEGMETAIEILKGYAFTREEPAPIMTFFVSGTSATTA